MCSSTPSSTWSIIPSPRAGEDESDASEDDHKGSNDEIVSAKSTTSDEEVSESESDETYGSSELRPTRN